MAAFFIYCHAFTEIFPDQFYLSIFEKLIHWDVSSVGLERRLDRAEVVGSNPSRPTTL